MTSWDLRCAPSWPLPTSLRSVCVFISVCVHVCACTLCMCVRGHCTRTHWYAYVYGAAQWPSYCRIINSYSFCWAVHAHVLHGCANVVVWFRPSFQTYTKSSNPCTAIPAPFLVRLVLGTCACDVLWLQRDFYTHIQNHEANTSYTDISLSCSSLAPVQVLHGCANDVLWLQRDFHIYLVNVFDTEKAAGVSGLVSTPSSLCILSLPLSFSLPLCVCYPFSLSLLQCLCLYTCAIMSRLAP